MTLQTRIQIMGQLGKYLLEDGPIWQACKERAYRENPWFIPEFIEIASGRDCRQSSSAQSSGTMG